MAKTIDKVLISSVKPSKEATLWIDPEDDILYYYINGHYVPLCEKFRELWDPIGDIYRSFDDSFNSDFGGDTIADMIANGSIGGGSGTNLIIIG